MARRLPSILFGTLLIVLLPAGGRLVSAQQQAPDAPPPSATDAPPPSYDTPPAITVVDGSARLLRQGQSRAATINMPLIEGDRIVTDAGRVAVTFPDGSLLHVDRNTTLDFLSISLMRLLDGRVILVAAGEGGQRPSVDYQIDAPAGSVRVQTAGEYKVSTYPREVELDVVTGVAALATDQGSVQVEAGERSFAREGEAPSYAEVFNSARFDAFDQWSESQRGADVGATSAQYLPSDLRPYSSSFDRYGRWESDASYGYVWYPTVSVGWRPYYNGYWDYVGPYGLTWIDYDPWGWPTHHFGRWGFRAGLWFWIPGRHWGPAWVSWAYSPGYYGWCPLDFYNRPVISLNFFFGSGWGYRNAFYDPWRCWTVVPRQRFGLGIRVANYAVPGARLPATARNTFAIQRSGPTGFAVPRQGMAAGNYTARAVPRALSSVTMQARPRDSAFATQRAVPRGVSPGSAMPRSVQRGSMTGVPSAVPRSDRRSLPSMAPGSAMPRGVQRGSMTGAPSAVPRSDRRSLPYSMAPGSAMPRGVQRGDRTNAYPGSASPRATTRQAAPYDNRAPSYRAVPRGSDRPPAPQAAPRRYESAPNPYRSPGASAPRSVAPARPRGGAPQYSAPGYAAPRSAAPRYSPPTRGESYAAPRYSPPASRYAAPAAPRYQAPAYSAPRYSPRASPRYSAPSYSAPAMPRGYSAPGYSAPRSSPPAYSAPRSSAPAYSAPRGSSGGYAAPRAGGGSAPRSSSPASSRPSSGSARPGGGRGERR